MDLSFAPLEGITSYIFRRAHREMFGGADKYYAPFIAPDSAGKFKAGNLRDVLPQNNESITLVPQILCNAPEPFLSVSRELADMGYKEVNLNVGCPSGTVVAKHKGAGMLLDLCSLDNCLADIFSRCELKVSVKTRLGISSEDEFPAIMEIYRKYPISELIIHARTRSGMYKSTPDLSAFAEALRDCPFPLCYNGNIFSVSDLENLHAAAKGEYGVMIGRGAAADPALFREIRGGAALTTTELRGFHDRLLSDFLSAGLDAHICMARLKELWFYWETLLPDCKKQVKAVYKSRRLDDYKSAVTALFSECQVSSECHFNK